MKKGIPLLGVVSVLALAVLAGGVAVDRSVRELPQTTSGGSQDSSPQVSDSTGQSDSAPKGGNVLTDIAHFFGVGGNADGDQASVTPGRGAASGDADPHYRAMHIFGTNISGLEFSGLFQPNTEQTYAYFKSQGMNTIRLPFDWNELQPDVYGNFDATSKAYLDQNIAWAKAHGLSVILDAHNYGRRYIYRDGGFGDDFASGTQHTFQLPYGDQDSTAGTLTFRDFGRGVAGTMGDPVAPHTGYSASFEAKIDSFTGEAWNEFYMDVFYQNDGNRYSLVINPVTNRWELRQTINGSTTVLASGSKVWTVGQYYHFTIDVNQVGAGKINVAVDGASLFAENTVSSDPALTHGKVSMFPSGVKATIKQFSLNVDGDTTSGGPVERRVMEQGLPLDAWKDFWTKLSAAYKDNPTVIGYDQNEPHDMPIATTPDNYSAEVAARNNVPVATASVMGQAMVDAIRSNGDDKFVVVEMDHWANTHYFPVQYGADPQPWIKDSLPFPKVVYSGHYYFDSDHSGLYASGGTPPTDAQVTADVTPFFSWCQRHEQICYEGEFGVPNTAEWQAPLLHYLDLMHQYNMWWTQWAGGDIYSSSTTLQPTSSYTLDRLQLTTIRAFLSHL
jgi:hypothetical protein